jgi:lysophospholipase L1-like esterase
MATPRLLFLGDSLIDFGNWPQRLPQYDVISRGMPGEHAEGLLWRLPERTAIDPDLCILMTGTNNLLFGDTEFPITIEQIITEIRRSFQELPVLVTSLLPYRIPGIESAVESVNEELLEIARRNSSDYFDLYSPFSQTSGELFEYDGVHLSEAGYLLWAEVLSKFLRDHFAKGED